VVLLVVAKLIYCVFKNYSANPSGASDSDY